MSSTSLRVDPFQSAGRPAALAGSSASPWLASEEEVEDTELVHAVAPDASIRELLVGRTAVPAGIPTGRAAGPAGCSPGPPTRTAWPASGPPGACPTWRPTLTLLPAWRSRSARPAGRYELIGAGGTSAGAPFWAGLIALADQQAGQPLGLVNPAIYRIGRGPLYHTAFHDILTGNNTVILTSPSPSVTITGYQAGPGWDPVTGWGTPDAQILIPLLAR